LLSSVKSFFTVQGQKDALDRITGVLNPFDERGTSVLGVNIPGLKTGIQAAEATGAAAFAIGSGAVAGTAAVIGKAFVAAPIATTAAVAVAPIPIVAAVKNPVGAVKTVGSAGSFYNDASSLLANPSSSAAVEFVKEHPVGSAVAAGVGIAAVGAATSGTITNILNTQAIKANTRATEAAATAALLPTSPGIQTLPSPVASSPAIMSTPQTVSAVSLPAQTALPSPASPVKKTTKKKKKKAKKKPKKKAKKKAKKPKKKTAKVKKKKTKKKKKR